ncbi:myb-like protein V [Dendronephthya gigantea]|uniref:myb-like protein V n=1 Tax=Dendronephthya gigantea TaxID=151771 RepID=UPI00106C9A48|nr:myb-like protein V [Dendronephthya gigantea]
MSQKDEKISFSEQITSRLHRWVQRTTSKVRNERAQIVRIQENPNILEVNELNEKKCPPRESSEKRCRESRSYEELEKALKDLINNCVTNDCVIQEGSSITHDNTNINITREDNCSESSPSNKTNNDIEAKEIKNSNNNEANESSSGSDCLQENENNDPGRNLKSLPQTQLHSPPHCQSKQTVIFLSDEERKKALEEFENDESIVSLNASRENEKDCNPETRSDECFNHLSKSSDACAINTSSCKVNTGLNPPIDRSSLNERRFQTSAKTLNKKQPLRRIQSEGDALELKLSFFDSDVSEFAATCVRHAQKKRFSDITPDVHRTVHSPGFLTEEGTKSCSIPKHEVSVSTVEENTNLFEDNDGEEETKPRHIPLSGRSSSLSLPLETSNWKNKASSFKCLVSSSLPRSIPSPSRSVPNTTNSGPNSSLSSPSPSKPSPSPKFRRFPYQPVFYVPKPNESRKPAQCGSVGKQSKEYLI